MDKEQIWNLYLPTCEEVRKKESYFSSFYLFLIRRSKNSILDNPKKLQKFVLVSLFPLYKSCNHIGVDLNADNLDYFSSDKERLANVEKAIGIKIRSTDQYLKLLGIPIKNIFFWLVPLPLSLKFYIKIMYEK